MSKYFSLIYSGEIHRSNKEKRIPAEEFSTLLQASDLLDKAKEDVHTYLEANKEACRKLLKEAEKAGEGKGLAEFNRQILHYQQRITQMEHELQKMILPLALKAAKKIVGKELLLNPEVIVDIVRHTLKHVTQNHHIKIYISKEDRASLEDAKEDLKKMLEHVKTFKIEEKEDLAPGNCIIETEAGIINATLENQWRALEAAFETFMKRK